MIYVGGFGSKWVKEEQNLLFLSKTEDLTVAVEAFTVRK